MRTRILLAGQVEPDPALFGKAGDIFHSDPVWAHGTLLARQAARGRALAVTRVCGAGYKQTGLLRSQPMLTQHAADTVAAKLVAISLQFGPQPTGALMPGMVS
jgi:hypothetical protein